MSNYPSKPRNPNKGKTIQQHKAQNGKPYKVKSNASSVAKYHHRSAEIADATFGNTVRVGGNSQRAIINKTYHPNPDRYNEELGKRNRENNQTMEKVVGYLVTGATIAYGIAKLFSSFSDSDSSSNSFSDFNY